MVQTFMNAMVMEKQGQPLLYKQIPVPQPGPGQVLVKVIACGICRTDLHIVDGDLHEPKLPLVPGHEIVGMVVKKGSDVRKWKPGDYVGIPWLGYTCGKCRYCKEGRENLCDAPKFTGYTIDGGYAEYTTAHADYCLPLQQSYANASGAPLMCAGLIGYRSYSMIEPQAKKIGIYGFGAAGHIIIQIAVAGGKQVYAFTKKNDFLTQAFARQLGAVWAGDSSQTPPEELDAGIIFAPAGELVVKALADVCKGAKVICAGIHMTDIPSFPYHLLWGERIIRSVANLTREDGIEFTKLAERLSLHTNISVFSLNQANAALDKLRRGEINGAAVLVM